MDSVVFIVSGDALDAERVARPLRDRGWQVETETRDHEAAYGRVGQDRPRAVVVSLSSESGEGALTRGLSVAAASEAPVLFVGGTPDAIDAARQVRPDAQFVSIEELPWAVKRFDV